MVCYLYKIKEGAAMNKNRDISIRRIMEGQYLFDKATAEINKITHNCDKAILHIIKNDDIKRACRQLKDAADWFDYPHPEGSRDLRGEPDFIAIRIIMALYERECYEKLPDDVLVSLKKFFTEKDYRSIYASENHCLMFRVSRMLAAQFYSETYFSNAGMSAGEVYESDYRYICDFIDFRAARSWGEFDSLGYTFEIMVILATLHKYTIDRALKTKCAMIMDIILLDMINDSVNGLYAGAHGRSYPNAVLDRRNCTLAALARFYFDEEISYADAIENTNICLSDYAPSSVVKKIAKAKKAPYTNYERKHLHCCSAWMGEIDWDELKKVDGSICKATYICEDYAIGAVNHQDSYPIDAKDGWYAHHQQHEWELTFPDNPRAKIFSHHRAIPDRNHMVNRWTGDTGCSCGSFYANSNTAIAMYDIPVMSKLENRANLPLINAYIPLKFFSRYRQEEKYLFLEYNKLFVFLYMDNGFEVNDEDNFANMELLSLGHRNAVVCRVSYKSDYASFDDFCKISKMREIEFDRENMVVKFDGIVVRKDGNSENGIENNYTDAKKYDCPYMISDWDSLIICVKSEDDAYEYNFATNEITRVNL